MDRIHFCSQVDCWHAVHAVGFSVLVNICSMSVILKLLHPSNPQQITGIRLAARSNNTRPYYPSRCLRLTTAPARLFRCCKCGRQQEGAVFGRPLSFQLVLHGHIWDVLNEAGQLQPPDSNRTEMAPCTHDARFRCKESVGNLPLSDGLPLQTCVSSESPFVSGPKSTQYVLMGSRDCTSILRAYSRCCRGG